MRWLATLVAGAVAVVPTATPVRADENNRVVVIVNRTSQPIYFLYGSCSESCEDWEEDLLGDRVLMPGRRISADMDDGSGECNFDFKAVLKTGREIKKWRVNVCAVTTVTFA